jgi:hypothetical protein
MNGDLLIQVANKFSNWSTINRVGGAAGASAQIVRSYMESVARMLPDHRVRAVDEDGRLIDILN